MGLTDCLRSRCVDGSLVVCVFVLRVLGWLLILVVIVVFAVVFEVCLWFGDCCVCVGSDWFGG